MITKSLKRFTLCGTLVLIATTARADVAGVLQKAGIRGGVACVIGADDVVTAVALAKEDNFIVQVLDPDPAKVAQARSKLADAGLLGRQVYIEEGSAERLPFADNMVDLVLAAHAGPDAREQIMRVITPIHGRAIIGEEMIRKPELQGSDWWTHKLRGPENNFASRDTAFQWPPILQFQAMPMHNAYQGAALSVPGRNIEISDWVIKDPWRANLAGRLIVRNAYNGVILWSDFIPKNIEPSMPIVAGTADTLFIAAGDRAAVLPRAIADGKPGEPIEFGGAEQRIRWLAVANGVLYTLRGPDAKLREPFNFALQPAIQQGQHKDQTLHCQTFTAYDLGAKRVLWSHSEPKPNIDFKGVALSNGRVIFYVEGERLVARDAATGKEAWRNESRDWIGAIHRPPRPHNWNNDFMSNLTVGEGLIRFTPFEARATILFREKDGQLLDVRKHTGNLSHGGQKEPIVRQDEKFFLGQTEIEPATGQAGEARLLAPVGTAWCGIATYAPGIGMIGHATLGLKSPCGVGVWVAGGVLQYFPTVCDCGAIPGAAGFVSGGAVFDRAEKAPEHPLVKGTAIGNRPSPVANSPDWPSYRGDDRHRGSSTAKVGAPATVKWTAAPKQPFVYSTHYSQHGFAFDERPAPPIVAGGRVFTAGSDGLMRAHGLADGKLVWSQALGGPVFSSPAVLGGTLFVPCLDGWVYALDTATGTLAWKRRLAPVERRIVVFGKLVSTWPVLSLVARAGRVYAVAGYFESDGAKAFALDAATGDIVWQRWFAPRTTVKGEVPLDSYGFGGQITIVKDKLWAAGLRSVPMVLMAATGEQAIAPADERMKWFFQKGYDAVTHHLESLGQEIVNLDDRAVLIGGSMLFENHNMRDAKNSRANFKLMLADDEGRLLLDVARLSTRVLETARLAPAYDDTGLCFVARYEKDTGDRKVQIGTAGLNFWDKAAFFERALKLQQQPAVTLPAGGKGPAKVEARNIFENLPYQESRWSKPEVLANAVALAGDAVVVAEAKSWNAPKQAWNKELLPTRAGLFTVEGWQVTAYHRSDGRPLWSVPLPAEPLFNGLAIAADGTVIVTLRDGSLVAVGK